MHINLITAIFKNDSYPFQNVSIQTIIPIQSPISQHIITHNLNLPFKIYGASIFDGITLDKDVTTLSSILSRT